MCVLLITRLLRGVRRLARKLVNHTSWGGRSYSNLPSLVGPQSLRVIELFVALLLLSLCPFDISAGVRAFVIGLSEISSFFSSFNQN